MNPTRNDSVLFHAGTVVGMVLRFTAADYEQAAATPGLLPEFRVHLLALATLRRLVMGEE